MTANILPGAPEPLGLRLVEGGANIAVFSETAERIDLCLFDENGAREIARLALPGRTGPVFHGFVPGVNAGARYGLRAHGPFAPERGVRFAPHKLLLDPFALEVDRAPRLHPSLFASSPDDSGPHAAKAVACAPPPAPARRRKLPWRDTIVYELHARGFTKNLPGLPDDLRGRMSGLAHPRAIAHLQRLGVTALELLPCAAWLDERHLVELGLANYWGYNPIAPLAPDPRLAPGGWAEVRETVAALQAQGFEVLIDVVLNHTGESDAQGPTVSLRGLDNCAYYRLDPANPAIYVNDAGCGNILRADHPIVVRLAMDALRAWAVLGGVDGFRFDLMTTLGRRASGFDPHAPLLTSIAQDPALRELKIIAEPWDLGPGGYQIGAFPALWGEWNDRFRDAARKFWRGDGAAIGELATRLAGSADLFSRKPASRSLNFITAHDGFTLADLVSFERKHNEANGEDNRDGTDSNHSWNNGVEGATQDEAILAARRRDQRNLLATLLFSRGTPMLSMGAEFGQSQQGNNNAYAQDNALSWLDWEKADPRLLAFTARALALRKTIAAFTDERRLTGAMREDGAPDVVWLAQDGAPLAQEQWGEGGRRFLGAVFHVGDSRAALWLNAGGERVEGRLPPPRAGKIWRRVLDTSDETGAPEQTTTIAPRSVGVFVEDPLPAPSDNIS